MTTPIPDGSAITTPNEMLTELRAVHSTVDRLAATLDPAMSDLRTDVNDHETRIRVIEALNLKDVPLRVRALEQARWKAAGGIAILSALVSGGVVGAIFEVAR